jgi:hypothetical protein|tara:strand:+ start:11593 stop:12042 length:450 start_codon:yes stop_codon:yes gene_type:complete
MPNQGSWKLAPGLNNVGSYQVSGQPFATGSCVAPKSGSALVVRFPQVTKWFHIEPHSGSDASLRVGFSEVGLFDRQAASFTGSRGAHFRIHASSSFCRPIEMKVSELWFTSEDSAGTITFDIIAGLTGIPAGSTMTEQGANWSGSAGVG